MAKPYKSSTTKITSADGKPDKFAPSIKKQKLTITSRTIPSGYPVKGTKKSIPADKAGKYKPNKPTKIS